MSKYKVIWGADAVRAIELELPEKIAYAAIEYVTYRLSDNPQRLGKPLNAEYAGAYSARISDYRIIYEINDDEVLILVVDVRHRATVYAHLATKLKR